MFRFTIRDVLWLTVVAALAVAWWLDKRQTEGRVAVVAAHAESLRAALKAARDNAKLRGAMSSTSQSVSPTRQTIRPSLRWA